MPAVRDKPAWKNGMNTDFQLPEGIGLLEIHPSDIEKKSFEMIGEELRKLGKGPYPEDVDKVVRRVIHTTADFQFADTLVFSPKAVQAGIRALTEGAPVITDTNMAKSGIRKAVLQSLGTEAFCFMADADVARDAKAAGVTRAVMSMRKAAELEEQTGRRAVFAIGNAPTALVELYSLIQQGRLHPRLIIGVPVGFVNVVQAKELILTLKSTPHIVARGRKGGSTVAAAIVNALLYQIRRL